MLELELVVVAPNASPGIALNNLKVQSMVIGGPNTSGGTLTQPTNNPQCTRPPTLQPNCIPTFPVSCECSMPPACPTVQTCGNTCAQTCGNCTVPPVCPPTLQPNCIPTFPISCECSMPPVCPTVQTCGNTCDQTCGNCTVPPMCPPPPPSGPQAAACSIIGCPSEYGMQTCFLTCAGPTCGACTSPPACPPPPPSGPAGCSIIGCTNGAGVGCATGFTCGATAQAGQCC